MTKQKEVAKVSETGEQALLSASNNNVIEDRQGRIRELEEQIRLGCQALMPGKCPARIIEEEGKIKWENSIYQEPFTAFSDVLKHLTATTDFELAAEIFDKGRNALPGKDRDGRNANLVLQSLADNAPKDAIEARLCLQATALYSQGMQYLARAENADMLCHSEFYMKYATKLLRLHNETIEAISKQRRGGEQRLVVQYVNVNEGGRAIVGNMLTGGGDNQKNDEVIP